MTRVSADDEFVEVLVPRHLVIDVYRLISEKSGSSSTRHIEQSNSSSDGLPGRWTATFIKRMYAESPKSMQAILDTLAAHAGNTVTATQLIDVLSRSRGVKTDSSTLGGTLGAFGRRTKNRYGQNEWPFAFQWSHEDREMHYKMSPAVAALMKGESLK